MGPDNQFLFSQYGSGIPGTPAQGNYAPSRADAYMAAQRSSMGETLRMQLLASDPRAVNMTNRLMDYVAGTGTSAQFSTKTSTERAEATRLMQTVAGIGINHPSINPFSGGNILNAAVGQSAAFANSSMRFQGLGAGGAGAINQFTGVGAATDMLTLAQMKSYNSYFSDSNTGLMKLNKSHGFGHSDLGEMQTYLGMSGAYSGRINGRTLMRENGSWEDVRKRVKGMNLGDGTTKNLMDAIGSAEDENRNVAFALDENSSNRMNAMLSDMAKTMKGIKNVFGGRPMAELMQIAEQLTGGSLTSSDQFNKLSTRLASATTFSASQGIETGAYLNQQVRLKQTMESMGMGSAVAASAGGIIARDAVIQSKSYLEHRNKMQDRGVYMRDVSMQEFEAIGLMDQKRLSDEIPEAAVYALMLQNSTISPEDRAKRMQDLKATLEADTGTNDPRAQARIQRQRINAAMQEFAEMTGDSVSDYKKRTNTSSIGELGAVAQASLGDEASSFLAGIYSDEGQRRNRESLLPRLASTMNFGTASKKEGEDFTKSILATLGSRTRTALVDSLESGGSWKEVINSANLSTDDKASVIESVSAMTERLGGTKGVSNSIMDLTRNFNLDSRNLNLQNTEDMNDAKQAEMTAYFARKALGGEGAAPSTIRSFAEGFLGADIITSQDKFAYAMKGGTAATNWGEYDVTSKGLKMSADQAKEALAGMSVNMRTSLELNGDDAPEKLADMLTSVEGLSRLKDAGLADGLEFDIVNKDGKSNIYSMNSKDAEAAASKARKLEQIADYGAFYGTAYMEKILDPYLDVETEQTWIEGHRRGRRKGSTERTVALKEGVDIDEVFKAFRANIDGDKSQGNKRLTAARSQFAKLLDDRDLEGDKVILDGLGAMGANERETLFSEALRDAENLDNFSGLNKKKKQKDYIEGVKALRDEFRQASGQTYLGRLTLDRDALDLFRMGEDQ
jgi:hypothetical protein